MKILVLTEKEMKQAFDMSKAIQADKDAMSAYSEGACDIPLRTNLDIPEYEGQSLYMEGYAPDAKALGVKIVSVYPNNIEKGLTSVPATMVLLNAETGEVSAIMDGTYLTRLRTGALSGAATDLLAREDVKVFALFGTGGQAETQLEAVLTARPSIEEVCVFDLSTERAEQFATRMTERFGEKFNVTIKSAGSADEAIENADVITSVTTSKKATFDGNKVKEGAHVNGVGSYTPQMAEIDEALILRADKIYCDTKDALVESGDITQPIEAGKFSLDDVTGELGAMINGEIKGRESDDEITYFETTGNAIFDLVTAQRIYEEAIKQDIGSYITFE